MDFNSLFVILPFDTIESGPPTISLIKLLLLLSLLIHSSSADFQRVRITDQVLVIHYPAKTFELYGQCEALLLSALSYITPGED
jgi:hypothetical protein